MGTLAQPCESAGNGSTMYQEGLAILKRNMMLVLFKVIHECLVWADIDIVIDNYVDSNSNSPARAQEKVLQCIKKLAKL